MKRIVIPLLALLAVSSYGPAQSRQGDPRNPTRIIIKFRPGAQLLAQARAAAPRSLMESRSLAEADKSSAPLASVLSAKGIVGLRAVEPDAGLEPLAAGIERLFIADLGPDADAGAAVRSLTGNPDIEYVEPDAVARITSVQANAAGQSQNGTGRISLVPNDPGFSLQWSLQNTGQTLTLDNGRINVTGTPGADINALAAWDISTGSGNIVLAVLDSGIALNHPEFAGRIVTGYDFVHQRTNTTDDQGHGTAVASVAAATGGNGILMAGVDWKCTILPVKVIDATGAGDYSNIISGLTYAADHGARVINLSVAGTQASNALRDAASYAATKGAILVASMGNDNTESPYYPAAYANVIAVGATNSKDQRAAPFSCDPKGGSNYGSSLDFVAPGDVMVGLSYSDPTAITGWCGTSLSAPVVSGIVSLILSVNPALNYDQVYAVLKAGARDQVGSSDEDTQGWDKYYGWGRIDAYRSLLAARGTSLFSHVAIGAGYTTIFAFLNTGSVPVDANLSLTDKTGAPLDASLSGPSISPDISESGNRISASTLGFTVPPGGTRYLAATRAGGGDPKTGWAKVEASGGLLGGVATFSFAPEGGSLQTVAGVLTSSTVSAATIPVDDDVPQQRFTGFAVANPNSSPITIKVVTVNTNGSPAAILSNILLKPGEQTATFLFQDPNASQKFKGSVVLIGQGSTTFSVVALVQNKSLFTAIPVIPSKAPNIN